MARSHRLGRRGEALAAAHLEARGWRILARSFRWGHKEIDIIAGRGDVISFVEVKTRAGLAFGHPLEGITRKQRGEIAAVARAWIGRSPPALVKGRQVRFRFDAVSVVIRTGCPPEIEHLEDAWRLEGR